MIIKKFKSIDTDLSYDELQKNVQKLNNFANVEKNTPILKKIFLSHSWEKNAGKIIITVDEFIKMWKNLNIWPHVVKIYKIK